MKGKKYIYSKARNGQNNENIEDIQTPNKIIQKIYQENNYQPNIISKDIKINNIPKYIPYNNLNTYNSNKPVNNQYSHRTYNIVPTIYNGNMNTPITYKYNYKVYNKKKLINCYASSVKNTFTSNPYTNAENDDKLNLIEPNPYGTFTELKIENKKDINLNNNNSPNIFIQNLYNTDELFNKNINEGLLYLKNYEIIKPNNLSNFDLSNEQLEQNNKKDISQTLSRFLIKTDKKYKKNFSYSETKNKKHYEIKKSYDSCRNRKKIVSKELVNGKKIERELSEPPKRNIFKIIKKGKISNMLNYFNNKGNENVSDILIIRGMRTEKGGVVDFTTADPKNKYNINKFVKNIDIINKNIYKYDKKEIISAAKIIQKWWRRTIFKYYDYLNKIELIQNTFRNYYNRKCKEKYINNKMKEKVVLDKNEYEKIKSKNNKFSVILLKKVLEVKLINIFNSFLLKIKDIISNKQNIDISKMKYIYFLHMIKDYYNKIKNNNCYLFMKKLEKNKNNTKNNFKMINLINLFFEGKKDLLYKNNNNNKSFNKNIYINKKEDEGLNKNKNIILNNKYKNNLKENQGNKIKINPVSMNKPKNIGYSSNKYANNNKINSIKVDFKHKKERKTNHLLLKHLMIDIIEKIKKEANRRTLIKAFRDINKLKYPMLFYSFLKIKKYSSVKYNVMNAYAKLIQKNYKYFKNKKSKYKSFYYS